MFPFSLETYSVRIRKPTNIENDIRKNYNYFYLFYDKAMCFITK